METAGRYVLLLAAGLAAGAINVVAGGGSFLSLPVLMFLGLPPGIANATNRLGIVTQNLVAVWSFDRHGVLERGAALWAALPATLGAGVGALLALEVSDAAFVRLLAILMIVLSLGSLWSPSRRRAGTERAAAVAGAVLARTAGFFVVGIYGGFVQAGVGFLFLALTSLVGLDLVRGNAVKVLSILSMTAVALAVFAWNGRVDWVTGGVLAAGFLAGGLLGARWTVLKGHRWVRRVVTATIILFALKLLLAP